MDSDIYEQQLGVLLTESSRLRPEFESRYFRWPILNEDTTNTSFDSHYIYHVAWAVRKVKALSPDLHVDFSSSLTFCTTVSSFCQTKFLDLRPANLFLDNLVCGQCDLSSNDFNVGQHSSISCMHVVEHIGLGRYGDKLDVNGDLKAIDNLKRALLRGGDLLFVVPCGKPGIYFNAHRVYSPHSILNYFGVDYQLIEFYFISGVVNDVPFLNPDPSLVHQYDYGCGCFHFHRLR